MTSPEKKWYKHWFNQDYLKLYHTRNQEDARNQIELILDTIQPEKTDAILDLGCGAGRHISILDSLGYTTFGLDLSETLLRIGKKEYSNLNLINGDIRHIPGRFDLILSLFSSFGYFQSDQKNLSVFNSIYQALNPRGLFWFDFLNPHYVKSNLESHRKRKISDQLSVTEKKKIEGNRVIKTIHIDQGNQQKTYFESVRMFELEELKTALTQTGFTIQKVFGDYSGSDWSNLSERTIIYCSK